MQVDVRLDREFTAVEFARQVGRDAFAVKEAPVVALEKEERIGVVRHGGAQHFGALDVLGHRDPNGLLDVVADAVGVGLLKRRHAEILHGVAKEILLAFALARLFLFLRAALGLFGKRLFHGLEVGELWKRRHLRYIRKKNVAAEAATGKVGNQRASCSRKRCASNAAMQPVAAEVTA